jgi:hypothetical protein
MNEKFFQYYRRILILEIYFLLMNSIIGDQVFNNSTKTLQFGIITLIQRNVEVGNVTRLKLTNIKD